jgi:hypothetical protein
MANKIKNPAWTPQKYAHELQAAPLTKEEKVKKITYLIFSIIIFPVGLGRLAKRGIQRLAGLAIYPAQLIINKDTYRNQRGNLKLGGYQTHYLMTPDKVRLHAMYYAQKKPIEEQKTVILFPGNGASSFSYPNLRDTFEEMGWNVLLFDPRHVGKSQRKMATCKSTILDGETAYQFAKAQGVKKENILLWGHSLGGGISAAVAVNHKKVMLVNDRSFSSLVSVIKALMANWIGTLAKKLGWEYNTEENYKKVQGKKWVVTATHDDVIIKGTRMGEKIPAEQQSRFQTDHNSPYGKEHIEEIVKNLGA